MLVYLSEEFIQKTHNTLAQSQGLTRDIERHLAYLKNADILTDNRVPFYGERRGPYYIAHVGARNRPIIGELVTVDNYKILYLHTAFYEHGGEYDQFNAEVRSYRMGGNRRPPYELDLKALKLWLAEQTYEAPEERSVLPPEYEPWLQRPRWETDWVVYEGKEWVNRFPHREFSDRWETMRELVEAAVAWATSDGESPSDKITIALSCVQNVYIAHKNERWIAFGLHQVPLPAGSKESLQQVAGSAEQQRQVIFLLAPFDHVPDDDELCELVAQHYEFLTRPAETLRFDDVAGVASRVYPWYIPLEAGLWQEIESEAGIHLALSAEEENILLSLSGVGSHADEYRLPIFINGRAGSGKSTILFYLFTEYLARFLEARQKGSKLAGLKGSPLFLTYNQELLNVARDRVQRMLKTRLLDAYKASDLANHTQQLMRPFREFLRSLLPKNDPIYSRYLDESRRITFHDFKRLYLEDLKSPEAKRLSPDLCWYVIRTFIKGYTLDGYLEPEEYMAIPSKEQRNIPIEDFQNIHRVVWKWYREYQDEHDLWDDQDLVRVVLNSGEMPEEEYAALFCDESQDFTRLELNLILHASVFSRYDLSEISQVECLPFAFAGDPLQTLNPTGFRWNQVQAMFHDQIIQNVDQGNRLDIRMKHLDELDYNYRSTRPIVETTNGVLLLRVHLFDQETRPQRFWGKGKGSFPPRKFILEDDAVDTLRRSLQDTILIIPCDEGGEMDYIRSDRILNQLFPDAAPSKLPKNILSAVGAKGLEFPRIILYKFGERCPSKLWRRNEELKPHERIEAEYFFNKLYVAATRATQRLFVIDSQAGDANLWSQLSETALISYVEALRRPQGWTVRPAHDMDPEAEYTVRGIADGNMQDRQEMVEQDLERIAEEFMQRGISAGNPEYLYRARSYYQAMNRDREADLCEAYALKFEKKWQPAGRMFKSLGELKLARECFWDGMLWTDLLTLEGDIPVEEVRLAHFMEPAVKTVDTLRIFSDFVADHLDKNTLPKAVSFQWRTGIAEYRQQIEALDSTAWSKDDWQRSALILEDLGSRSYPDTGSAVGQCYANAGDLQQAIRSWERSANTQHNGYYTAKAQIQAYPQNLEWWEKAGEYDKIYNEWLKSGGLEKSDTRTLRLVTPILEQRKRYWDVCQAYLRLPETDVKKIIGVLNQVGHFTASMVANRDEVKGVINFLASRGQWEYLMSLQERLFQVITRDNERMELRYETLRRLATAKVTDDLMNGGIREKIYRSLVRPVKDHRGWNKELDFEVMGAAVEKLGFDMSLRFYEAYLDNDMTPSLRDIARRRWLANADEKIQYHRERNEEDRTLKMRSDFTQRKRDWEYLNKVISESSPAPSAKPVDREALVRHFGPIKGLPDHVKMNETGDSITSFQLGKLNFTFHRPKKMVKLEDDDFQTIIFDLNAQDIRPTARLEVHSESTPDGRIFSIPAWGVGGKIAKDGEKVVLEIAAEGLEQEFTIEA